MLTCVSYQVWYISEINEDYRIIRNLALQWRHNGRDSLSDYQLHDCYLNRLFRHRSKKTSKLRATGLSAGNSPEAGEIPAQMASNAKMFPFDDVIMPMKKNIGEFYLVVAKQLVVNPRTFVVCSLTAVLYAAFAQIIYAFPRF